MAGRRALRRGEAFARSRAAVLVALACGLAGPHLAGASLGCADPAPRGDPGGGGAPRGPTPAPADAPAPAPAPAPGGPDAAPATPRLEALREAVARRPLSPRAQGHLGYALLEAGHPGRGLLHLRAARFLIDEPAAGAGAGEAASPDLLARIDHDLARARGEGGAGAASAAAAPVTPAEGGRPAREVEARRTARRIRRGLDAARAAFGEGRYADALALYEEMRPEAGSQVERLVAACHVRLAVEEARRGRYPEAIEHLLEAADREPAARTDEVYRDVARLERRHGLRLAVEGDAAGATAAFLRAFVAFPDDPETLFLLARRPEAGAGALPAGVRPWFRGVLQRRHAGSAEAAFLVAAEQVAAAPSPADAQRTTEAYARAHPGAPELAAELKRLVTEQRRGEAAREAEEARLRYERMLAEAKKARLGLESRMGTELFPDDAPLPADPDPEVGPEPDPPPRGDDRGG